MANTTPSANMNLPIPVPGVQSGPQYAININDCLTLLDAHNHTPGFGAPIVAAALDINDDLPINDHNITLIRTARFSSQNAALALASDLRCAYVVDQDLYFNDGSGNSVRITQNGAVAGTPGSIANLVSPASATYVAGSTKFVFQSNTNTAANLDAGSILLRNLTASSFALTLSPPTLSSNYSITLPALPAAAKIVTMDSSGAMSAVTDADNSTIEIASNLLRVKASGITSTQMAPGAVIIKSQTFTSSGNFTVPAGVTNIMAFGLGGGGGGGGSGSTASGGGSSGGGGGGGGAQGKMQAATVTPGDILAVTVGAGGAAGTASGSGVAGGPGTAGGTSSVGTLLYWRGGAGGSGGAANATTSAGGPGAIVQVFAAAGGNGATGGSGGSGNGGSGSDSNRYIGGAGGTGSAGAGGGGGGGGGGEGGNGGAGGNFNSSGATDPTDGSPGVGYGAGGGGGGGASFFKAGRNGGAGYQGLVTIYWVDRA